jgi:tetratricopeptide (TPR) repeat protein
MKNYEEEFLIGAKMLVNGSYQSAISHIENALFSAKLDGLNLMDDIFETGYFNLGQAKKATGDYKGAINYYQQALKINPTRFENAYLYISDCCFELDTQQSISIAITNLNSCTKYFPKNDEAFMNKGIAYLKLGDRSNAKSAFDSAKLLGNNDADKFIIDYCD